MEDQHRKFLDENREKPIDSPGNENGTDQFQNNDTTGSGFSEAERSTQDGTSHDTSDVPHAGSESLIDHYNINDKAHSDSSLEDFIPTTSNYHHAENPEDTPEDDGRH